MRRDRAPSQAPPRSRPRANSISLRSGARCAQETRGSSIPTILAAVADLRRRQHADAALSSETRVLIENRETVYQPPREATRAVERDRTLLDPEAVQSQVQISQSRDLARKVVQRLKLDELQGIRFRSSAAYQIMTAARCRSSGLRAIRRA